MRLFSRDFTRACGFFYLAPHTEAGGGTEKEGGTLKQQLSAAIQERDAATSAKDDLQAKLDAATGKVTGLENEKKQLADKVTMLEGEKKQLSDKVTEEENKVKDLQAKDSSAEHRAREIAAANGVEAPSKTEEARSGAVAGADGKAHFDRYSKLMQDDPSEASAYFAKHEKALLAFANSAEARA